MKNVQTRAELDVAMQGKTRGELLDVIFSLMALDRLMSARQIAEASGVSKRDVLAAMKAGAFVDPLFGRGFFCRASNSLRVSARAANAWRRSFFVPVLPAVDSITGHKKESAASEIGLGGKNAGQMGRRVVRELSPGFLAGNGAK
jgi:hypothetical protein